MSSAAPSASESRRGYHRLALLDTCRRKYGLRYGLGLEAATMPDAPALGSLFHLAAMHHYRALAGLEALDPVEAMRQAPASVAHQFAAAVRVWERYLPWAAGVDRGERVLDVEREFSARLGGRFITARLDLVVERGGVIVARDHKTGGGNLAAEVRAYEESGQIALIDRIGAGVLPDLYGLPWGTVEINCVSTSGAEPVGYRAAVVPPRAWQRDVLESLKAQLALAGEVEARADWGTEAGAFALGPSPEACKTRFKQGRCEFYGVCRTGPAALRSPHLPLSRGRDEVSVFAESAGL